MGYSQLVSPVVLAQHCNDPDWVILDCRFDLGDPEAGRDAWSRSHVPGSQYADLEKDLSGTVTADSGRHPLPDPGRLAGSLSSWGVGSQTQVVVYDNAAGAIAARAWWLLRWLGHPHTAVLDGGLSGWRRLGLPLVDEPTPRESRPFVARPRERMVADATEVAAALERGDLVLDARAASRYLGEEEPFDDRSGHIPGAHNFPFTANLDRHGRFLTPADLRLCYDEARQGTPPERIICMCGSGVTACHNLLAMEIAGLHGARLFPGSWSEWSRDGDRPVATGPDCDY